MFASVALATRIDRAEKGLTESLGRVVDNPDSFIEWIGGGVAVYAGPFSPMNKMIAVGFDGAPSEARILEIEQLFKSRNAPLQAEVSTLADPAFAALLTSRGYVLRNFENVSGRPISNSDLNPIATPNIDIQPLSESRAGEWMNAAITGFQHPDGKGVQNHDMPPREAIEAVMRPFAVAKGFRRYCAFVGGQLAGTATLRIEDGVAQLCGASTLPAFRRRGVQTALLRRRFADSAQAGCDLAVITTQPGSTSQENAHRQGFALLYPRAILVKEP